MVMADRGFTICESAGLKQAKLVIPAFTKGRSQLHPVDGANEGHCKCENPCGEGYWFIEVKVYYSRRDTAYRFSFFQPQWNSRCEDPHDRPNNKGLFSPC